MAWVVVLCWIGAVVAGLVILGFCAYELTWKANRLRRDVAALQTLQADLVRLRDRLIVPASLRAGR